MGRARGTDVGGCRPLGLDGSGKFGVAGQVRALLRGRMETPDFLVLHVTDLHLSADPAARFGGVCPDIGWAKVRAACRAHTRRPDLVIVTGDLSEDGSAASYARLATQLAELKAPVVWTAGNHDDRAGMDSGLASLGDPTRRVHPAGVWRVIVLDSQVVGESHGHLAAAELAKLDEALAATPDSPVLVALHHGPRAICPMSACRLLNADALLARLHRHASPVVTLSGHNHCEADVRESGIRMLVTPSTCLQLIHPGSTAADDDSDFLQVHALDGRSAGWRWLSLGADGSLTTTVQRIPVDASA